MNDDVIPLNEIGKIETVKVYNQAYVDKQQKRIADLEKENAELKETVMKMNNVITETFSNLTRAKEHIKQLLDCLKQDTNDPQTNYYVCKYMDKAEQFLSEVEK